MAAKESFRERQTQELEVIKSIFGADVEDLRPRSSTANTAAQWKPTEIRIFLTPLRDSSNGHAQAYVSTKLRITCPSKYPKLAPKIELEESKGMSDQLLDALRQKLQAQSQELRGEVMIYELAQTVQGFLLEHNKPPKGSFYDEMLQAKQKREQELQDIKKKEETLQRQTLIDEVERRKEMFKTEAKRRGEPRRSMSESNNRHPSSSESSESSSPYYRGHIYPTKCLDHRNTETLYFHKVGRQVQRACCLGHSQKGFIAYTGIDIHSGQLLFITEWNIKYSQIEAPCGNGGKCHWQAGELKCSGSHRVDDVIASIEKQVAALALLQHKNLIQYECVLCIKRKEGLLVYLVQDFLLGTSVFSISSSLGWCMDGARMVARGVLDALVYLHNKGVSHSHLLDSTVFMDNTGNIRCTDFSLVPSLLELISGPGQTNTHGDLPALGALIEGLMPTKSYEMRDFVDKCHSDRTLSASELLEHPFLRFYVDPNLTMTQYTQHRNSLIPTQVQRQGNGGAAVPFNIPTLGLSQSRLRHEFEVLMYLGKGAFGDVLKVRNILDNREYAIKRIPLPARSRQLYKKMTREVELLSRLNHENVVRYFNSWIEAVSDEDLAEMDQLMGGDGGAWSHSQDSNKPKAKSPQLGLPVDETESSSSMWNGYGVSNMEDSDSDGIEFVDSNGQVAVYDEDDDEESELDPNKTISPRPQMQVMYIQMEFCEKCTLRTAIDDNLYENTDRLWRLFREIAEGLSHIHQQGIIHRDLKPVNIFLDSHDQIKIGDFGLATTSFLALQSHTDHPTPHQSHHITSTEDGTGTGKVGTTLYVAPELTGNASKSVYNQKVDMYTLGIILFEMCLPPFDTSMERAQTIMALRSAAIVIPESLLMDSKYEKTVRILRWLLDHDPATRPTAEELLVSDLVPPAELEANELQEMLRHALANPQSKAYKNLVARCLQQESDEVLEHTYHLGSSRAMKAWNSPIVIDDIVSLNPVIEFVKAKVVNLFRKHGAIEVDSPLLSPLSARNHNSACNAVHLMTHSGCVVLLPCDLRTQFARHVTMNGVNLIRRYCVDRVYREERVFNFHPKQNYECSFDIITPTTASHLVDAELLSLAFEITNELPRLKEKNLTIRMNHTNLLRAILIYCNVPKSQYGVLFGHILDFIESRTSRFQFHSSISVIMEKSRTSAQALMDMLLANFLLTSYRSSVDDTALKSLVRGKGEAASLARAALRDLETVVCLSSSLGVTCPIHIWAGLPISFERAAGGGIVWQMTADLKPNRSGHPSVLAVGERYDTMLHEFQKQAQSFNAALPTRGVISGAGISFSLDKLVAAVGVEYAKDCRAIDIGICVCGTRPPLKDVTFIMRLLWSWGIRCGILEASNGGGGDEALDLARLGALHVILVAENGGLRVRSFERDRFQERHLTRAELVEFIQKVVRSDSSGNTNVDFVSQLSNMSNAGGGGGGRGDNSLCTSNSTGNMKNNYTQSCLNQLPHVQVIFLTHEKLSANYRRRLENQVVQQMSSTLTQFIKKESFVVLVVELPPAVLNAIVGAINPRENTRKETEPEMNFVIERFPKYRRYISEIHDEILDFMVDAKTSIVALYSISDSYYRVII